MRMSLLFVVSVMLAGCASAAHDDSKTSQPTVPAPSTTHTSTAVTTTKPTTVPAGAPAGAPAAGAAISDVIRWIEAGTPADPAAYHSATRDGVATPLGSEVAFITAGSEANCMTDGGAFACLVKLTDPPPRPPDVETGWKDNWVDFDGTSVEVGSPHADPGPFGAGTGAELATGHALHFGDYRCRADAAGLFCVNYAHQAAVRLSSAGVEPFGCLQKTTPPPGIGQRFSC